MTNEQKIQDDKREKAAYMRVWRKKNPEKAAAINPKYIAKHTKDKTDYDVRYNTNHQKERHDYRVNHRDEISLYNAEYHQLHIDERQRYFTEYERTHKEVRDRYSKAHLPEHAAYEAARRALIVGVTIGNLAGIKDIYLRAKEDPKVRCYLCGKLIPLGHRHVDHIIPISKGGLHGASNLAVACDKCNWSKHNKMPEELGLLI